eukprot:XP_017449405.1 PREDICTED: serine/arginine repetitive matrix protein 1-like [Rattus norvegicus]
MEAERSEAQVEEPGPVNLEMPIVSPSKRKQPLEQKREEKQSSEGGENSGPRSKSSANGKENTCPSLEPKVPRQKRSGQSWAVSSCRPDKRSNELDEKRRARPFSSREIGREKHGSSHRRDSSHTKLHVKDRRPQLRSPVRTLKRRPSGDSYGAPYNSAKRRRHPSPEALSLPTFSLLMSESSPTWVHCRWPWTTSHPRRCLPAWAFQQQAAHCLTVRLAHLAIVSRGSSPALGSSHSQFHLVCTGQPA